MPFEGQSEAHNQFGEKSLEKRQPPPPQQMPAHLPFEGAQSSQSPLQIVSACLELLHSLHV